MGEIDLVGSWVSSLDPRYSHLPGKHFCHIPDTEFRLTVRCFQGMAGMELSVFSLQRSNVPKVGDWHESIRL
jgi:hypothetical protein